MNILDVMGLVGIVFYVAVPFYFLARLNSGAEFDVFYELFFGED